MDEIRPLQRVGDGNRWAFCKVLLQNAENSPKFKDDLQNQLKRDEILSNAVRTFCYRFEQMFTMLERHDFEHYLTKIFEEGSLGRVYSRFVEACREIDGQQSAFLRSESTAFEPSLAEENVSFAAEPEQTDGEQAFDSAAETIPFDNNETEPSEYSERREMSSPFEFLRPTR